MIKGIRSLSRITVNLVAFAIRLTRFLLVVAIFYVIYKLLLSQFLDGSKEFYPMFGLWVITAYFAIPRIHRILTKYYLPNYFVGRIRSSDGLLSDPVNLAFFGSEKEIHNAMKAAGWEIADHLTPSSFLKIGYCSIFKKSYKNAPVGSMYLFNRRQDFAYQQQIGGSPNERHHVRFWKTPNKWYLPGGHKADWLAAATYDTHVGLKIATGQIDHIIHESIDVERDYIIKSLKHTGLVKNTEIVKHFTNAYHDRNNGGDRIKTDGSLPFIHL